MTDKLFRRFDALLSHSSNPYDGEYLYLIRYVYSRQHTEPSFRRQLISHLNLHSSSKLQSMTDEDINTLYNQIASDDKLYQTLRSSSIGGIRYHINEAEGLHSLFVQELDYLHLPSDPVILADHSTPLTTTFVQLCQHMTTLRERLDCLLKHPSYIPRPTMSPSIHHL